MKKYLIFVLLVLVLLGGCATLPSVNKDPSYEYNYRDASQTSDDNSTVENTTDEDINSTVESTEEIYSTDSLQTESNFSHNSSEEKTENNVNGITEASTTVPENTTAEEIELNISMPEKNGTMVTDTSADNKFIEIVNSEKKIDKSLLVAVYAVPESGQNYVFEFYNAKGRSADDIRRVYLIDKNGKITGVAATDSSERVGIGSMENWFSMNVLIKEVIYPAVKDNIM